MIAIIKDTEIVDITNNSDAQWDASLITVQIPNFLRTRIDTSWIYDGTTFTPPDVTAYVAVERERALALIRSQHAEMLAAATGGATAEERDTWAVKEAAARDVLAGGTGWGVLRPVEGETLEQLANKVLARATAFKTLVGIADQIKREAEKAVETLTLEVVDDLHKLDAVLALANQQALEAVKNQ